MATQQRFGLTELLLATALAATVTLVAFSSYLSAVKARRPPAQDAAEWAWLERTYGPSKHSEYAEEWIVRDFFEDRRDGVFVDVGAGNYLRNSNTYYLETALGWRGVAFDAQPQFAAAYTQHRPRTTFVPAFISNRTGDTARLFLSQFSTEVASAAQQFTERWGAFAGTKEMQTITLNDALDALKIDAATFVNMDIELYEPKALAGFDIARFHPELVCVEAHPEVRQAILSYFQAHDYELVGKYLRVDMWNLYFMPKGHTVKPFPTEVMNEWTRHPREGR